jgi:hypothetical protein
MIVRRQRIYSYCDNYYLGDDNCYYYPQQKIFFGMPNFGGFMRKAGAGIKNGANRVVNTVKTSVGNAYNRAGRAVGDTMTNVGERLGAGGFISKGHAADLMERGQLTSMRNQIAMDKRAGLSKTDSFVNFRGKTVDRLQNTNNRSIYDEAVNKYGVNKQGNLKIKNVNKSLDPMFTREWVNADKPGMLQRAANKVGSAATGAYNSVKSGVSTAANKVGSAATGAYNSVHDFAQDSVNKVQRAGASALGNMGQRIANVGNAMVENSHQQFGDIVSREMAQKQQRFRR